jgi:hypothetical protein
MSYARTRSKATKQLTRVRAHPIQKRVTPSTRGKNTPTEPKMVGLKPEFEEVMSSFK